MDGTRPARSMASTAYRGKSVTGGVTADVTGRVIRAPGCDHSPARHYPGNLGGRSRLPAAGDLVVAAMVSSALVSVRSPRPLAFTGPVPAAWSWSSMPTILRSGAWGHRNHYLRAGGGTRKTAPGSASMDLDVRTAVAVAALDVGLRDVASVVVRCGRAGSPRQRSGAPTRRSSSWKEGQPSGWPARDFPHGRARQSPVRAGAQRRTA